ncbi:MAG: glycosyltransferase family 2 protein [SAR202 cluster bacterium]|nr:glycosyltransferase family 2 protein [SAR202 cluster bacterium]
MSAAKKSLDVVIPILNEEAVLATSVGAVYRYLGNHFGQYDWRVVVADNGSTDRSHAILEYIKGVYKEGFDFIRLDKRGRGRALKKAWTESGADIVCYMDVDLSTNLADLVPLIESLDTGGYEVAIGSRLIKGSRVEARSGKREIISRSYNLIIRLMFGVRFRDAQCGFKALTRRAVNDLVPLIEDPGWFFDTELLLLAEKNGYKLKEVPVRWTDDPDSRVKVFSTARKDMQGLFRMKLWGLRKARAALAAKRGATS